MQPSKHYANVLDVCKHQGPKMALHAIDKLAKKGHHSGPLLALKASILVQLGKEQEGMKIAQDLLKSNPTEIETLKQLEKLFVTINDYKSAAEMYENAFNKTKTEEIGIYWFLSVLRLEDLKNLFTAALKLKSIFNDSRYTYWAALALYLQASQDKSSKEILLAQKMISKELDKENIQSPTAEEINLFLMICSSTSDFKSAYDVFNKHIDQLPKNLDLAAVKAELLTKQEQWKEAAIHCSFHIETKGFTDWSIWKSFISAFVHWEDGEKYEKISNILKNPLDAKESRSLLLARVDASLEGYNFENKGAAELLLEYAELSEKLSSRIPDITYMLKRFSKNDRSEFLEMINEKLSNGSDMLFWAQLKRITSINEGIWNLSEVHSLNSLVNSFETENVEQTTIKNYLLAILELDFFRIENKSPDHLASALGLLKHALEISPDDFLIRILTVIVALLLGSIHMAMDVFRGLDIKQIQIDTLSYLMADHLLNLGDLENSEAFFHEAFFVYDDNRTHTISALADLFLKQSYSKIPEFYELFLRLEHSIQSVGCILQTIRSELLQMSMCKVSDYLEFMRTEELFFTEEIASKITDNRDTDLLNYVDQSEAVKTQIFSLLPTFDKSNIWVYTSIPLILKSLMKADYDHLKCLKETYDYPSYLHGTTASEGQINFVKSLLNMFSDYKFDGNGLEVVSSNVHTLLESMKVADFTISDYKSLAQIQWAVESTRWLVLCIGMLIHGHKMKTKKFVFRSLSICIKSIADHLDTLRNFVGSAKFANLENCSKDMAGVVLNNWKYSLGNFVDIIDSTKKLINEINN